MVVATVARLKPISMTTAPVTDGGRTALTYFAPPKWTRIPTRARMTPAIRMDPVTSAESPPCALIAATAATKEADVPRYEGTFPLTISRKMIVATPDIITARFGLSPMIAGNTNVAPNIATTCCAPRPAIRSEESRSPGRTTAPAGGVRPS